MSTKKEELKNERYQDQSRQAQQQEDQQASINSSLDRTKENIRRSIDETKRDIPRFAQSITDFQERAIDTTRNISDNYIDSQKEIINSLNRTWISGIENTYWWLSPRKAAEIYAQTINNFADTAVATTKVVNNATIANIEASKVYFERAKDIAKDLSTINVNTAKTIERAANQTGNNFEETMQR